MAAAKVQKINQVYEPPLAARSTLLYRLVRYFKSVDGWTDLQNPESRLTNLLKSIFLSSKTYSTNTSDSENEANAQSYGSELKTSFGTISTLSEAVPITLDTECLMLLGLLFCEDRDNLKAQIFYSILRGACSETAPLLTEKPGSLLSQSMRFDELYCVDEAVESTVFKMCVLSTMFIEYYALPLRAGKTEVKMIQTAFALR